MKPLFIPLKAKHFDRFDDGSKDTERRVYGKKWNIGVLHVGRPVVLSRGYGKARRIGGKITDLRIVPFAEVAVAHHDDLLACYGEGVRQERIVEIKIAKAMP